MRNWRDIVIGPTDSMREAIRAIDGGAVQLCLVADKDGKLLGTISDGDVRRAILRGVALDVQVTNIMNCAPTVARLEDERNYLLATMRAKQVHRLPLVDSDNRLTGLDTFDELLERNSRDNIAVLMAGGLGQRLLPLTEDCPKPLLKVGGRPILETILINLIEHGFQRFYISVNYKAGMIRDYFGDGSQWSARISYLEEPDRMGTAGALALLPERPAESFLVMNADLLTKANFSHLMDFHEQHRAAGTMCVREHTYQIPYGVVKLDRHHIRAIEEKPRRHYFFNAGIYVLAPQALELVSPGVPLDMPVLFDKLLAAGRETAAFHLRDYWLDIGQPGDFEQAQGDYAAEFE